jgi:hypothetical protein
MKYYPQCAAVERKNSPATIIPPHSVWLQRSELKETKITLLDNKYRTFSRIYGYLTEDWESVLGNLSIQLKKIDLRYYLCDKIPKQR